MHLEVLILKELWADFAEVQIPKELSEKADNYESVCGAASLDSRLMVTRGSVNVKVI